MVDKRKYSAEIAKADKQAEALSGSVPDTLFGGETGPFAVKSALQIPVRKLIPSARNPYHVTYGPDDPWMEELCSSVREQGILSPLIARPIEGTDTYEIISGHRRHHAAMTVGLKSVPVIVKEMNDDEAAIQMVDCNLNREELLFSEKAFAYRMKYEAVKHSWGGSRKASEQKSPGDSCSGNALNDIARQIGISPASVRNYLNLTRLCEELLGAVDRKEIPMKAGVQLSYLRKDTQRIIWRNIGLLQESLNEVEAEKIRRYCEEHPEAGEEELIKIISHDAEMIEAEEKQSKATHPSKRFRLTKAVRNRYFPADTTDEEICSIICQLLHGWALDHNPEYSKEGNEND